jgi:hypothetical protein
MPDPLRTARMKAEKDGELFHRLDVIIKMAIAEQLGRRMVQATGASDYNSAPQQQRLDLRERLYG